MKYLQADKVQPGAVIETTVPLSRARKVLVPAGTQGVVQEKEYRVEEGQIYFTVKWNVRGEEVCLPISARDAKFVASAVCV